MDLAILTAWRTLVREDTMLALPGLKFEFIKYHERVVPCFSETN